MFSSSQRALLDAITVGDLNAVNSLLKEPDMDPAMYKNMAIQLAVGNGHIDIVNRLLEDPRVNPADDDNSAMRYAIEGYGGIDEIERLLQDPRVDWTLLIGTPFEYLLRLDERKKQLRNSFIPILGGFRNISKEIGGPVAARSFGGKSGFEKGMVVLCSKIQKGSIPSVELFELLDLLYRAKYISKEDWEQMKQSRDKKEVCDFVGRVLRRM